MNGIVPPTPKIPVTDFKRTAVSIYFKLWGSRCVSCSKPVQERDAKLWKFDNVFLLTHAECEKGKESWLREKCRLVGIERVRRYQKKNVEKIKLIARNTQLRIKYGITLDAWRAMFDKQGRKCANPKCGRTTSGGKYDWHTDHDHKNGKVRGILCHGCNRALGGVADDTERLEGLVEYLKIERE